MKKLHIAFLVATILSISPIASAKNSKDTLADVVAQGCSFVQIAPYGTSLLASWDWENGTSQTKFGGDAVFMVEASTDGGTTWSDPFEVEFELDQYVPGTSPDDYFGLMVYRCSNAQTEVTGSCNGSVLGLRDAVLAAAADYLGVGTAEIGANIRASLDSVKVKAMNPGKGNGPQNYELQDVCAVDPT